MQNFWTLQKLFELDILGLRSWLYLLNANCRRDSGSSRNSWAIQLFDEKLFLQICCLDHHHYKCCLIWNKDLTFFNIVKFQTSVWVGAKTTLVRFPPVMTFFRKLSPSLFLTTDGKAYSCNIKVIWKCTISVESNKFIYFLITFSIVKICP